MKSLCKHAIVYRTGWVLVVPLLRRVLYDGYRIDVNNMNIKDERDNANNDFVSTEKITKINTHNILTRAEKKTSVFFHFLRNFCVNLFCVLSIYLHIPSDF